MTRFDASLHHTLAVDAATEASGSFAPMHHAAQYTVERMPSTSTSMSAQRCLTAWNDPIGRPNCTRSFAYSTAISSARAAPPSKSAAAKVAPRSMSRSRSEASPILRAWPRSNGSQPSSRVRSIAGSRGGRSRTSIA